MVNLSPFVESEGVKAYTFVPLDCIPCVDYYGFLFFSHPYKSFPLYITILSIVIYNKVENVAVRGLVVLFKAER